MYSKSDPTVSLFLSVDLKVNRFLEFLNGHNMPQKRHLLINIERQYTVRKTNMTYILIQADNHFDTLIFLKLSCLVHICTEKIRPDTTFSFYNRIYLRLHLVLLTKIDF